MAKVRKKFNYGSTWSIPYLNNKSETKYEPCNVYTWDKIKQMHRYKVNPDININQFIFLSRTKLTETA